MTPMEGRGLLRGGVILLTLSLIRLLLFSGGDPVPVSEGMGDDLPSLLKESLEEREGQLRRSRPLASGEKLDPNRSSEEDLDRLPGVGPSVASAIVRYRVENGGFHRPEDLLLVRGIGPATLS